MDHAPRHHYNGTIRTFRHSVCCSQYGVDVYLAMSWSTKNFMIALDINSPPLSEENALSLCSDCVSISAFNFLNLIKHLSLAFNTYNHTFLEKLSMKVTKYFAPPMDVVRMGPHTSECTISKGFVARLVLSVGNDN